VGVGPDPVAADEDPRERDGEHGASRHGRRHLRGRATAAAVAFIVVAVACGIGWLYLLRAAGALRYGPEVSGALPLQQLDRSDALPLARVVAAWIPAGAAAGLALRRAGLGVLPRVVLTAGLATVLLIAAGAVSDAATVSGAIPTHVTGQLTRAGTWVAVGLMTLGAALVPRAPRAARAAPSER
jgi:hypothetical protein